MPALLAIQSGIYRLRYATLMGIKRPKPKRSGASRRPIWGWRRLAAGAAVERLYLPQRTRRAQLFEGDPQKAAAQLVEKLRFEARVI